MNNLHMQSLSILLNLLSFLFDFPNKIQAENDILECVQYLTVCQN